MDGSSSRLSKRYFFHRFTALASTNPDRRSLLEEHVKHGHMTYTSLKHAAQAFGEAKAMLQSSFTLARLGQWVKKPFEQDSFEISFNLDKVIKNEESPRSSFETNPVAFWNFNNNLLTLRCVIYLPILSSGFLKQDEIFIAVRTFSTDIYTIP